MKLLALLIAIALVPTALSAQAPTDLKIAPDKPYRHKPTGLTIPPSLSDIPRTRVAVLRPNLDEFVRLETANGDELITVYVFRHTNGSVPVWADRVVWQIEHRDVYGGAKPVAPIGAFKPPGQTNASGLIGSYKPGKGPYRSTAFAFMPLGPEWYVAVRYSSVTLKPDELDGALRGVITEIGWPKTIAPQPDAAPVADCTTPLTLTGLAEPIKSNDDMTSALMAAVLGGRIVDKKGVDLAVATPTIWCRDVGRYDGLAPHGVYRPVGTADRYLIAFCDAGVGVTAYPSGELAGLVKTQEGPSWSITRVGLDAKGFYRNRDRLPSPDQTFAIVNQEPPMSSTTTWGKNAKITINTK